MGLTVARAGLGDVQTLAAEYQRDGTLQGAAEPPLPTGAVFWLARDEDGEPVGYAACKLSPEGIVAGPVYVRAQHRRSGVGMALIQEIERWATGARIPVVEVSVAADNPAGVRFLEAAGFSVRRLLMARDQDGQGGARVGDGP